MKKVFVFIPILMSSLSLVSCGPVDFLPPINSLENTASIIEPEKVAQLLDKLKITEHSCEVINSAHE